MWKYIRHRNWYVSMHFGVGTTRGAETRLDPSWTSLENLIGMFDEPDDFGQAEEGSVFQEIDQFQ